MQGSLDDGVPVGTVIIWTTANWQADMKAAGGSPEHWLECNGQNINSESYPKLARIMSHTPNYTGLFLRGRGGNADAIGQVQGDAIRNIWGSLPVNDNEGFPLPTGAFNYFSTYKYGPRDDKDSNGGTYIFNASFVVPTAEENRPINTAVVYLVKAK